MISSPIDSPPQRDGFEQSPDDRVELEQLADALIQRGYSATVITPAPYVAVRTPGITVPQMIYRADGRFWWQAAQVIAPSGQTRLAAEVITWALRAYPHRPPTHDVPPPLALTASSPHPHSGQAGGEKC